MGGENSKKEKQHGTHKNEYEMLPAEVMEKFDPRFIDGLVDDFYGGAGIRGIVYGK